MISSKCPKVIQLELTSQEFRIETKNLWTVLPKRSPQRFGGLWTQDPLSDRGFLHKEGLISRETNFLWQLRLHERLQLLLSATEPLTEAGDLMWINWGKLWLYSIVDDFAMCFWFNSIKFYTIGGTIVIGWVWVESFQPWSFPLITVHTLPSKKRMLAFLSLIFVLYVVGWLSWAVHIAFEFGWATSWIGAVLFSLFVEAKENVWEQGFEFKVVGN